MNERTRGKDGNYWFERLCTSLRPDLYRFAFWLSRDRQVAEDVVQETLLRAWKSRDSLTDPAAAKPWLLTIVRREHARIYERKRFETVPIDEVVDSGDPALETKEDPAMLELRKAIFALPDEYREPLVMQVLLGLSTQEIADQLGLTQRAVLTRLFRARNKLRVAMGLEAVDDAADAEG